MNKYMLIRSTLKTERKKLWAVMETPKLDVMRKSLHRDLVHRGHVRTRLKVNDEESAGINSP